MHQHECEQKKRLTAAINAAKKSPDTYTPQGWSTICKNCQNLISGRVLLQNGKLSIHADACQGENPAPVMPSKEPNQKPRQPLKNLILFYLPSYLAPNGTPEAVQTNAKSHRDLVGHLDWLALQIKILGGKRG